MARYRIVELLDAATAAYIAGLIHGEGTVTLERAHRNENRRLAVSIGNNELPILQFVRGVFGAGRITTKRTYDPKHARSYTYKLTSRQALALLRRLVHHLRSCKVRRAQLAVAEYVPLTPRNGKYNEQLKTARVGFETRLLAIRP